LYYGINIDIIGLNGYKNSPITLIHNHLTSLWIGIIIATMSLNEAPQLHDENIITSERFLPKDVLPTIRYYSSKFQGFNSRMGQTTTERSNHWEGVAVINGFPSVIRIAAASNRSHIVVENDRAVENWVLDERYSDIICLHLLNLTLPGTVLGLDQKPLVVTPKDPVGLMFLALAFKNSPDWKPWVPKNPSEFPIRRVSEIDYDRSGVFRNYYYGDPIKVGFRSVEDGITVMMRLKDAIEGATPLPKEIASIAV